jgi:hypothetical protein
MSQANAPKFAFYYMLSLVALVFTSIAAGMIIFQIINKYVDDPAALYGEMFSGEAIRFAISALVIASPIFFILTWQIQKSLRSGALSPDSAIRRWLTYFILFVSSVVMIGWLIGTLNNFLNGELSLKFALKALTSILISALVFSYYFLDIRRPVAAGQGSGLNRGYFYGALALVIGSFVWSLFVVDSPALVRQKRVDQAILNNFDQIDGFLVNYYSRKQSLPENLQVLKAEETFLNDEALLDPTTKEPIEYRVTGDRSYELCATFQTGNREETAPEYEYLKERWPHDAGRQCLPGRITDDRLPAKPNQ